MPRVDIAEDVRPDASIDTQGLSGLKIGASVEVNYHVMVPRTALVRARATNGEIVVEGISGRLVATTTNGAVSAREMSGGVEARATNGRIAIEMNAMGTDPIDIRTTNGAVDLKIPKNAKAYVTANSVNGGIDMTALTLELMGEQSKRRVRGRMNDGGIPIDVATTNGRIWCPCTSRLLKNAA